MEDQPCEYPNTYNAQCFSPDLPVCYCLDHYVSPTIFLKETIKSQYDYMPAISNTYDDSCFIAQNN